MSSLGLQCAIVKKGDWVGRALNQVMTLKLTSTQVLET